MITPDCILSGNHPAYELFLEQKAVVGAIDNPILAKGYITEDEFETAGQVAAVLAKCVFHLSLTGSWNRWGKSAGSR